MSPNTHKKIASSKKQTITKRKNITDVNSLETSRLSLVKSSLRSQKMSEQTIRFGISQSLVKLGLAENGTIDREPSALANLNLMKLIRVKSYNCKQKPFSQPTQFLFKSLIEKNMNTSFIRFSISRTQIESFDGTTKCDIFFESLVEARIIFKDKWLLNMKKNGNNDSANRVDECFIWFSHNLIFEEFL